jgi:hypothetical protein
MKEIAAINTVANGCYAPTGIKVGHKQRLWVACNYNNYEPTCLVCSGVIQVYAPGSNSPLKTYSDYMHIKCSEICYDAALPNDVAFDDKGHVFAANLVTTNCIQGHTHVCSTGRGGWTWWRASSPKSVHIEIGKVDTHFYYLDVDATGNLYITGAGTNGNGSQVFEITNPTGTSPGVTSILGPTKDHLGGLYVSNRGKVLNIVDETARTISQYALPWVTSELPINVLGPTLQESGKGVPISGGFDLSETRLALGDGMGWLDLGDVAENKWTVAAKNNLGSSAFGAAYVPSDK